MSTKTKLVTGAFALVMALSSANLLHAQDEPYDRALDAYKKKDWNTAIRYARDVVADYPEWFPGYKILMRSYSNLGQHDNAIDAANKALDFAEDNDQSFEARYVMAVNYYRESDFQNALKVVDAIEQRHRNSKYYAGAADELHKIAGYSNFSTGKYKDAIAAFKPLMDSGKASADVLRAIAKSHQELGQNKEAIQVITQVVRKDPKDLTAHRLLVKSYLNDKQYDKVIDAANAALKQNERDWELHFYRGVALKAQNRLADAETALIRSITIEAQDEVRRVLGHVLMSEGKWRDAIDQLNAVQRTFRNDPKLYYNIAYSWYQIVPKNAEDFHQTNKEKPYLESLANSLAALDTAEQRGFAANQVAMLRNNINNKMERLEKGGTYEVIKEFTVDPETGEIIETVVSDGSKK